MRALYVNHTSRVSGGELSLLTLLAGLPAQIEPVVACPEGDLARRLQALDVEVIPIRGTDGSLRLHPARTPRALAEMGIAALQLRQAASRKNADLVHANSIRAGLIAAGAGLAGGPPTVVHVRDCLPEGRVSELTLRAIGRADAVIANSSYTRSTLGPAKASATVVHNAVDLSRFDRGGLTKAEAQARIGLEARGPVLAVVAQITPWKGQDDAIRIAAKLLAHHPDLKLLLVGSAKFDSAATRYDNKAFLESLRRQVDELGIGGSVRFLGQRDDIPEILRGVDLLLVPSWEEPFGRAIIEAMAAGVPVVATDVGGPPEILRSDGGEECGLVLPPQKPDLWAEAIAGLLADPGRLATMAGAARRTARARFGLDRHVGAVVEVYERVARAGSETV